jgi:hypothetical protein
VTATTDVSLRSKDSIRVGFRAANSGCFMETLIPGHVVWYRLAPGYHEVCGSFRDPDLLTLRVERIDSHPQAVQGE